MIVALAIATGIPPAAWLAESDDVIATALDILAERNEKIRKGRRRRG